MHGAAWLMRLHRGDLRAHDQGGNKAPDDQPGSKPFLKVNCRNAKKMVPDQSSYSVTDVLLNESKCNVSCIIPEIGRVQGQPQQDGQQNEGHVNVFLFTRPLIYQ